MINTMLNCQIAKILMKDTTTKARNLLRNKYKENKEKYLNSYKDERTVSFSLLG